MLRGILKTDSNTRSTLSHMLQRDKVLSDQKWKPTARPEASTPSIKRQGRKGKRVFTSKQTNIVKTVTENLPDNVKRMEILQALAKDGHARENGLVSGGHFSDQQGR